MLPIMVEPVILLLKDKGMVRTANRFVKEGKWTKHAEFGYPVTKFISSDA